MKLFFKNNRNAPIQIEINDQVPISGQSDITVEISELSGADFNAIKGKVTWIPHLDPGKVKAYKLYENSK